MPSSSRLQFVALGANPVRLFGLSSDERACRLARQAGLEPVDKPDAGCATIVADLDFAWDPAWLRWLAERPGTLVTLGGRPVLAHIPAGNAVGPVLDAMRDQHGGGLEGLEEVPAEGAELTNSELRKRSAAFVLPVTAQTAPSVERAAYEAAYKGIVDILTLYVWKRPAFYLTCWAARAGLSPNMVTAIGAILCVLAFLLFWTGHYWLGVASGFAFMVLDTVDGKLARVTGTSSRWGNAFDHGIDLVHPLFWYWAWAEGLDAYGTAMEPVYTAMLLAALAVGYVAQRAIEGLFIVRFAMHIHVWKRIDSRFRLITARRNPNMVLLVVALAFGRPDVGLELITLWTLISLLFHWVRLVQAGASRDRGEAVASWLE